MDLHKIGIKIFAEQNNSINLHELIPVFHHWIQDELLDTLMIDVADYSHVNSGPGIVLVAHEGNYAFDETDDRRGMVYYSKHNMDGDFQDRLATVCRHVLSACLLLQEDEKTRDKIKFHCNEIQIFSNDRLVASNSDETYSAMEDELKKFLDRLYSETKYKLNRDKDPKERLKVNVIAETDVAIDTLLERVS